MEPNFLQYPVSEQILIVSCAQQKKEIDDDNN